MSGSRRGATAPAVSLLELNRWTLARQMLLERADLGAVTAIERLGGLQAQLPRSPYIALWSRLRDFRAEELERALVERRVVKSNLMRITLHLVSGREFHLYRRALETLTRQSWSVSLEAAGDQLEGIRVDLLERAARGPLSRAEALRMIAARAPRMEELERFRLWYVIKTRHFVADPSRALFRHPPNGDHVLAPELAAAGETEAAAHLVRAHLAAFGPASRADTAEWSGQTVARLLPGYQALGPELAEFAGPDGELLFDLRGAPRPPAETPAPARYLARWDSLLLGHKRRHRVISDPDRKVVIRKNGDVMESFTVGGLVAGMWAATQKGGVATLTLTPLRKLARAELAELTEEGERLLAFLAPGADCEVVAEG